MPVRFTQDDFAITMAGTTYREPNAARPRATRREGPGDLHVVGRALPRDGGLRTRAGLALRQQADLGGRRRARRSASPRSSCFSLGRRPTRSPAISSRRARGRTSARATTAPACASTRRAACSSSRRTRSSSSVATAQAFIAPLQARPRLEPGRRPVRGRPRPARALQADRPRAAGPDAGGVEARAAATRSAGHGRGRGRRVHRHGARVHAGEARAAGQRVRAVVPQRLPDRHRDAPRGAPSTSGCSTRPRSSAPTTRSSRRPTRTSRSARTAPTTGAGRTCCGSASARRSGRTSGTPKTGPIPPSVQEMLDYAAGEEDQAARLRVSRAGVLAEPGVADRARRTTRSGCTATSASAACRTG